MRDKGCGEVEKRSNGFQIDRRGFLWMTGATIGSIFLGSLVAGCSSGGSGSQGGTAGQPAGTAPGPAAGGTLRVGINRNLNRIDPRLSTAVPDIMVCWDLFDGLLEADKEGRIRPSLATEMPRRIDDKTFSIVIRQGVKFHDGSDLTAEDVKYTVETINDPNFKSLFTRIYGFIDGVEVKDKHTAIFHLKHPTGPFLERLVNLKIVPKAAAEKAGNTFEKNPVGSGPFKFESWTPNGPFAYGKNEQYWQKGIPRVDKVIQTTIAEDSTRVAQLRTGQVDLILPAPYQTFATIQGGDLVGGRGEGVQYTAIRFNNGTGPFANKKLRHALAHAIDRDALIKTALNGLAVPADQQVWPSHWAYNKAGKKYAYDPEKAKALMKEAGFPNGFEFEMLVGTVSDIKDQATVLQEQFARVGIKMGIKLGEVEALYQLAFKQEYHAHLHSGSTAVFSTDPDILYRWLYGGPVEKNTFLWWKGPGPEAIVKKLDESLQLTEKTARQKAYYELQDMISEELPLITLNFRDSLAAWRKNVTGFVVTPTLITRLWDVGISS